MRSLTLLAGAVVLAAACDDSLLPQPVFENRVDTVSIYALSGTPVSQPSAYSILERRSLRTDQAPNGFDFAIDIDTAGRALLLSTGALRLGRGSGIQLTAVKFDSLRFAPTGNYQLDSAVVVDSGAVAILHSRQPQTCAFFVQGFYAKLHVLGIDTTSGTNGRRIDFEILTDINCGYRGLEPGLPRQ